MLKFPLSCVHLRTKMGRTVEGVRREWDPRCEQKTFTHPNHTRGEQFLTEEQVWKKLNNSGLNPELLDPFFVRRNDGAKLK
mmetsp:Transcript_9063/g.12147  ORF Transcript_9063/g.12147 Transcript_9063/m.12147 type:complete len:81 (+) Transcript_9063:197-439(+)